MRTHPYVNDVCKQLRDIGLDDKDVSWQILLLRLLNDLLNGGVMLNFLSMSP
jgi:hypothetical protein